MLLRTVWSVRLQECKHDKNTCVRRKRKRINESFSSPSAEAEEGLSVLDGRGACSLASCMTQPFVWRVFWPCRHANNIHCLLNPQGTCAGPAWTHAIQRAVSRTHDAIEQLPPRPTDFSLDSRPSFSLLLGHAWTRATQLGRIIVAVQESTPGSLKA